MAIQIPDLAAGHCRLITVCGDIQSEDAQILEWCKKPANQNWLDYGLDLPTGLIFARVGLGGNNGKHCHVDLATPENFTDGSRPRPTLADAEFQAMLIPLIGQPITMSSKCKFVLEVQHLPSFVLPLVRIAGSSGKVKIRLVGGELAVEGSAVRRLEWRYRGEGSLASLTLTDDHEGVVSDTYLVDAFERMRAYLRSFQEGSV